MTQVAGRAGRGDREGRVIVQTFTPDNFALTSAARHDYRGFYNKEIQVREYMNYPPFTDLIMVEFTATDEALAVNTASACREYLQRCRLEDGKETIFDPRESYSFKGKDSYRYYILIKCPKGLRNMYVHCISSFGDNLVKNKIDCTMIIDVNPYGTL